MYLPANSLQTIAVLLTSLIAALIPDTPKHIKTQIHREAHVTNQIILHAELQHQGKLPSAGHGIARFRKPGGLQDPVLRDVFNRLAETDAMKQPSTALPIIGFYSFEEDSPPVVSSSEGKCDRACCSKLVMYGRETVGRRDEFVLIRVTCF